MAETSANVDGRRERADATRRNILNAARALILQGDFDPTAQAIAKHSGITRRTLFRHFPDMETLHHEIIIDAQRYAQTVMDEPFPQNTTKWSTQIEVVIERRVRIFEYLMPLYISAVYQSYRTTSSRKSRRGGNQRRRARLEQVLPSNMVSNNLLLEALNAILSIDYWITLRQDQQLTVTEATKVLGYAVCQMTGLTTDPDR